VLARLKERARRLKADTYTLYLAARDPRTPLLAKVIAAGVVAYAFSPIDLIPDFIPIVGYLDDLVLVPLGIAVAIKLVPPAVLAESREQAATAIGGDKPVSRGSGRRGRQRVGVGGRVRGRLRRAVVRSAVGGGRSAPNVQYARSDDHSRNPLTCGPAVR